MFDVFLMLVGMQWVKPASLCCLLIQAEYEQEHELEIKREITLWNKIVENQTKELKRYVNSVK